MTDVLLNTSNDLQIANDDLVVGYSDLQQQQILLLTEPGSIKQYPAVGVGLINFVESEDNGEMLATIKTQFAGDGLTIDKITIDNGKLQIDAQYPNS